MVKKIIPLLLCSFSMYAADPVKKTDSAECALTIKINETERFLSALVSQHDWIEKGCHTIQPNSFTTVGKAILATYLKIWVDAAQEAKIPTDSGLAQIFATMQQAGPDKLIIDLPALLKANEYHDEYDKSPSKKIEDLTKKMFQCNGNYYFPGAKETVTDRVRITRQNEFYNIMYKRHESPKMPENNLVAFYNDQTVKSAQVVLKLNIDNKELKSEAISGITLLSAYYLQEDNRN